MVMGIARLVSWAWNGNGNGLKEMVIIDSVNGPLLLYSN